ncbi:MAG: serine protease [Oscillospiraceae bacterium]|nr:serine protease [Oscillospiraceae bacterium]
MPSWGELLTEVQPRVDEAGNVVPGISVDALRGKYMAALAAKTGRNVIAYYSGWLQSDREDNVSINDTDMTGFMNAMKDMDFSKGLDLILHTPGGYPTAAEAIVNYLHSMFGNDIRVIVPHMAMSAGTMISCSAKSILMGKHSALGPVDPQFGGTPAYNIVKEFMAAKEDMEQNPNSANYWAIRLSKYPPAFLYAAQDAIELSNTLVGQWLRHYMFEGESGKELDNKVRRIRGRLNSNNMSHGRHFNFDFCRDLGLKVEELEADVELQDLVLSVHHAFTITLSYFPVTKMIQNQYGVCYMTRQEVQEE